MKAKVAEDITNDAVIEAVQCTNKTRHQVILEDIVEDKQLREEVAKVADDHRVRFAYIGKFNDLYTYLACIAVFSVDDKFYVGASYLAPADKRLGACKASSRLRALQRAWQIYKTGKSSIKHTDMDAVDEWQEAEQFGGIQLPALRDYHLHQITHWNKLEQLDNVVRGQIAAILDQLIFGMKRCPVCGRRER